jgi:hypothetical protein
MKQIVSEYTNYFPHEVKEAIDAMLKRGYTVVSMTSTQNGSNIHSMNVIVVYNAPITVK